MAAHTDTVTVQVELPREDYERVEAQALKERRSVEQMIPSLVSSELGRIEGARRLFEEASALYRARLKREGKLNQTPEEILADLRAIREQVADELFPE